MSGFIRHIILYFVSLLLLLNNQLFLQNIPNAFAQLSSSPSFERQEIGGMETNNWIFWPSNNM